MRLEYKPCMNWAWFIAGCSCGIPNRVIRVSPCRDAYATLLAPHSSPCPSSPAASLPPSFPLPLAGMLAGGSGITPMYQVACAILNNPSDRTKVCRGAV